METDQQKTYSLCLIERRYKQDTLFSYYFQSNKQIIKKYTPFDIDNERLRLNLETGEIDCYKRKQINESKNASIRRTKIMLKMLLEMNEFDWFCTLTFDKKKIDRTSDKAVYDCYKKYINNLSHQFPTLKYICVLERHEIREDEDYGCIHFHLLIGGVPASGLGLVNSGKVCCSWANIKKGICSREYFEKTKHLHELKETDGEIIYNITSFAYGLTTASKIVSPERCKSYVAKYINKEIGYATDTFKKRFYYSKNLNVPAVVKRCIGSGFDKPQDITSLDSIMSSKYVEYAKYEPYVTPHNGLQFKVDNYIKDNIDNNTINLIDKQIKIKTE